MAYERVINILGLLSKILVPCDSKNNKTTILNPYY